MELTAPIIKTPSLKIDLTGTKMADFLTNNTKSQVWAVNQSQRTISTAASIAADPTPLGLGVDGNEYNFELRRPYVYNPLIAMRVAGPGSEALLEQFEKGKGGMELKLDVLGISDSDERMEMFLTAPATESVEVEVLLVNGAEMVQFPVTAKGGVKVKDLLTALKPRLTNKIALEVIVKPPIALFVTQAEKEAIERAGTFKVKESAPGGGKLVLTEEKKVRVPWAGKSYAQALTGGKK